MRIANFNNLIHMKKLIYGILSGMLFTGCTSDELLRRFSVASASDWVNGAGVASYENLFYNSCCILLARGNSNQGGHQWICDGLQNYEIRERYFESQDGGLTWELLDTTLTQQYFYVHYNWGWHGKCNGYYYHTDTWARSNGQGYINFDFNRQIIPIII